MIAPQNAQAPALTMDMTLDQAPPPDQVAAPSPAVLEEDREEDPETSLPPDQAERRTDPDQVAASRLAAVIECDAPDVTSRGCDSPAVTKPGVTDQGPPAAPKPPKKTASINR